MERQATFNGGRLILLNSVLSFIPLYYIFLFKFSNWVLIKIDKIRKKFLWAGTDSSPTRKYHLVKWKTVCRAKEYRGWGILNLEQINCAFYVNGDENIDIGTP
jgi:hypothetical protein